VRPCCAMTASRVSLWGRQSAVLAQRGMQGGPVAMEGRGCDSLPVPAWPCCSSRCSGASCGTRRKARCSGGVQAPGAPSLVPVGLTCMSAGLLGAW
jgi:hypothetical protein